MSEVITMWRKRFRNVYERKKHSRPWSLTEDAEISLAAFCAAWAERDERFNLSELIDRMMAVMPELAVQQPDEPEKLELESMPVDSFGNVMRNPWAEPIDRQSQAEVLKRWPKTAAYFERVGRAGGYTAAIHVELLDKAQSAARVAAIHYDANTHKTNPFCSDDKFAQGEFVKTHSPEETAYWQREAVAISTPWQRGVKRGYDLGQLMQTERDLFDVAQRASQIEAEFLNAEVSRIDEMHAKIKAARADIEGRLNVPAVTTSRA
jgi:hypothetical protein